MQEENVNGNDFVALWMMRCVGIIATDFFAHPFYTIWTMQQSTQDRPLSFLTAAQKMKRVSNFYAGFSPQAVVAIPGTLLYFAGQKTALYIFGRHNLGQCMQGPLGVGFGMLAWSPAATITMRKQASSDSKIKNIISDVWKKDGVRGFYRGTSPGFCAFSITDMLGFWIQAKLLAQFSEVDRKQAMPKLFSIVCAFGITAFLNSPIEVVFARAKLAATDARFSQERGMRAVAQAIYRTRGARGFFTGLPAHMTYNMVWHSVLMLRD